MSLSSRFFNLAEFGCHDGTPYPASLVDTVLNRLCLVLDTIRAEWTGPILVVSGYRTPAWNTKVGGAPHSRHVTAEAADVRPLANPKEPYAVTVSDFNDLISELIECGAVPDLGGRGYYEGKWVHVDVRQKPADGHIAMWVGQGVGSEQAT